VLIGCIRLGGCLVQSHTYPLHASELYQITTKAKLRRILTAGNIATKWIAAARLGDKQVLDALRIIKHIYYTGVGIDKIDQKFADEHGLVITSLWASTEAGTFSFG
jgi:lactate dehydrogenase-like 2-hydroxyacid dehydrogenase